MNKYFKSLRTIIRAFNDVLKHPCLADPTVTDKDYRVDEVKQYELTPEALELALTDESWEVREAVLLKEKVNLSPEQIERALTDRKWLVRLAAVDLGNLTENQIRRAMGDKDWLVREAAKEQSFCVQNICASVNDNNCLGQLKNMGQEPVRAVSELSR